MKRNYAVEVNSSVSKFYKTIGIIIVVITAALFLFKTIFGYTKMVYLGDYELTIDYEVGKSTAIGKFHDSKDGSDAFYVHFTNLDEGLNFVVGGEDEWYDYYTYFSKLGKQAHLSVFSTPDGYFTAYESNCSKSKAEREYRKINKPGGWYLLYIIGFTLGIAVLSIGIKANKTAQRQKAYIKYEDIQREKAIERFEKPSEGMSPGEMSMAIQKTLNAEKKLKKKRKSDMDMFE